MRIVTDTASSMVKAFKLPGYEYEREDEMKLMKTILMKMIVIQVPQGLL